MPRGVRVVQEASRENALSVVGEVSGFAGSDLARNPHGNELIYRYITAPTVCLVGLSPVIGKRLPLLLPSPIEHDSSANLAHPRQRRMARSRSVREIAGASLRPYYTRAPPPR